MNVIDLQSRQLSPSTQKIIALYREHFGDGEEAWGGYLIRHWARIDYINSILPKADSILDVGILNGVFLNLLILEGRFKHIYGLDIKKSKQYLELFEPSLYHVDWVSATKIPHKNKSIDIITCMEVLEHLNFQDFPLALSELRRIVKHKLIITVPYKDPYPLPPHHKLSFADEDFAKYFSNAELIFLQWASKKYWVAIIESPLDK